MVISPFTAQVLAWAKSMNSVEKVVRASYQMQKLDDDKDAFSHFLESGSLRPKFLRSGLSAVCPNYVKQYSCLEQTIQAMF